MYQALLATYILQDFEELSETVADLAHIFQPTASELLSKDAVDLDIISKILGGALPGWPCFVSASGTGEESQESDTQTVEAQRMTAFTAQICEVMGFQAFFANQKRYGMAQFLITSLQLIPNKIYLGRNPT